MLNIHNTLTNYAEAYQGALTIKKEAEKVAGEKYIGIAYAEEIGKIKDAFHAVIDPLRDTSMKSVQKAITDARTNIQNVVSKPMDAELAQTIDVVRKLPNVTLTEKESVLARCAGNYIATRLCIDALELQGEHLPPKVDEILKSLDLLEPAINTFFNSSAFDNVNATYMTLLVLNGSYTNSIIGEVTAFVDTYK